MHRISRIPFLGNELLATARSFRDFDAGEVIERCRIGGYPFILAAVEPEFQELLGSVQFEPHMNQATLVVANVTKQQNSYAKQDMDRLCAGVSLGHCFELMARQADGVLNAPLLTRMFGTSFVLREKPDTAVIVRWWNPEKAEFTPAFGEANHGPSSGYVLSAVPTKETSKWLVQGMRVAFPF